MPRLFVVPVSDGSEAEIMFRAPKDEGPTGYSTGSEIIEKAADTLVGAFDLVRRVGHCAAEQFAALAMDAVEVKIGLSLNAKGKFIVAEAGATASVEVKFTIKPARLAPQNTNAADSAQP